MNGFFICFFLGRSPNWKSIIILSPKASETREMGDEKKGKRICRSILLATWSLGGTCCVFVIQRNKPSAVPGPADPDGVDSDDSCEHPSTSNRNQSPMDLACSPLTLPPTCQGRFASFGLYCALNSQHRNKKLKLKGTLSLTNVTGEYVLLDWSIDLLELLDYLKKLLLIPLNSSMKINVWVFFYWPIATEDTRSDLLTGIVMIPHLSLQTKMEEANRRQSPRTRTSPRADLPGLTAVVPRARKARRRATTCTRGPTVGNHRKRDPSSGRRVITTRRGRML